MCFAIPGKIVERNGDKVVVDYGDQKIEAGVVKMDDVDYGVGDFVIVQGKIIVEKVPEEQIEKWRDFLKETS